MNRDASQTLIVMDESCCRTRLCAIPHLVSPSHIPNPALRLRATMKPLRPQLAAMKALPSETDFIVVGAGIAAALSDDDEVRLHLEDTLKAGDGLCNEEAARILVEEGPPRIEELIAWGTEFDRAGTKIAFTREGAHSRSRVLHAHGDSTGREIGRALYLKAAAQKAITFREFEFTTDLLVRDGRVAGVRVLDQSGQSHEIFASSILLATGGLGHVYSDTTNPSVATGDGVA